MATKTSAATEHIFKSSFPTTVYSHGMMGYHTPNIDRLAKENPEDPDYPKDPKFKERYGPRGVLRYTATDKDDPTEQPRWGRIDHAAAIED